MLRAVRVAGRLAAPRLAPAGLPRPPRPWAPDPARTAASSRAWAAAGAAAAAAAAIAWAPAGAAAQCARPSEGRRDLARGRGPSWAGSGPRRGKHGRAKRRATAVGPAGPEARTVELKVREHGAEAAAGPGGPLPTVVLVHGLDSWHGTWRATAEELALRGVRTVAVDLRGHGLSPLGSPEDFGPAQLAADVRAALRKSGVLQEGGGKRIVLVGHSMGGKIAMRYTADYPDDVGALVIEDMDCTSRKYPVDYLQPSAAEMQRKRSFDRAFPDWETCRASLVSFGYGEARVDSWLSETPPRVIAQAAAGLGSDGMWSALNPYAQWLARTTVLTQADAYAALHRIAAVRACDRPDLEVHVLVAGPAGTVCDWQGEPGSIRDMEGVLPGLRVTEFPSAGHSIHNSDPAGFLDHLVGVARSAA